MGLGVLGLPPAALILYHNEVSASTTRLDYYMYASPPGTSKLSFELWLKAGKAVDGVPCDPPGLVS